MIVNLLSGIIQNTRNRRAAERAQTQALNTINAQQSQLDNLFNNEYYGDYMNRSDVQSMLRSMQDQMRQQNAQSYSMAAMTGATPEAMAAQLSNNTALMGNTYNQIGANMSNWKSNILNNYINNSMALSNQKVQLVEPASLRFQKYRLPIDGPSAQQLLTNLFVYHRECR